LLLVSGRWDNTVLVIDLGKAMDPANDGTPNAIVNRVRVTPDIDVKGSGVADTPASGQPVNVVLSPDRRRAYVVNHSGSATPDAAQKFQHGHAGTVTILDVAKIESGKMVFNLKELDLLPVITQAVDARRGRRQPRLDDPLLRVRPRGRP
jgi:hypothetical protein